jgi:hypothetical protein
MKFLWLLIRRPFCKHRNTHLEGRTIPLKQRGKHRVVQAKWCKDCRVTLSLTEAETLYGETMMHIVEIFEVKDNLEQIMANEARERANS